MTTLPTYTRKATGLVREVSLLDQVLFNAASTAPVGAGLVFGLFALLLFPRANILLSLAIAAALGIAVWVTFALMSAAIPRIGGDYTFNTRILSPFVGFAGNLCVFVATAIAAGLWAWWFGQQAIGPAFSVIGSVTGSATLNDWGTALDGHNHLLSLLVSLVAIGITSGLAILGTRVVTRTMTMLFLVAVAGFVVDMLILLFTGHDSFVQTVNDTAGAGAYQDVVAAGAKDGLSVTADGFDARSTFGAIYSMIGVTVFVWWGTYMAAEFKGGGQRRRQLQTVLGAGLGQSVILFVGIIIFLNTVGRDFFASALAGNYTEGPAATASYAYFSALVADNSVVVTVLALTFIGWWLPGLYINQAMIQRAVMTWSFDGLAPSALSKVNERSHTPIVAIVVAAIAQISAAAWVTFDSNFFRIFAIMQVFSFIPIVLVGLSAALMRRRRSDLYRGSPGEWRVGGVDVLPVAGCLTAAFGAFALFLVYYFHENLGLTGGYYTATIIAPFLVAAIAGVWWWSARAMQRSRGVDLGQAYLAIPPD